MNYYVYKHIDPYTGELVYVGIGKGSRAWVVRTTDTNYGHRSEPHGKWMSDLLEKGHTPDEWVVIFAKKLTKKQALEVEKHQIMLYKPKFNKIHNPNHWSLSRKYPKENSETAQALREMGYSYHNIGFLLGAENPVNFAMNVKRMLTYVTT